VCKAIGETLLIEIASEADSLSSYSSFIFSACEGYTFWVDSKEFGNFRDAIHLIDAYFEQSKFDVLNFGISLPLGSLLAFIVVSFLTNPDEFTVFLFLRRCLEKKIVLFKKLVHSSSLLFLIHRY
jgi:hypothetical protein